MSAESPSEFVLAGFTLKPLMGLSARTGSDRPGFSFIRRIPLNDNLQVEVDAVRRIAVRLTSGVGRAVAASGLMRLQVVLAYMGIIECPLFLLATIPCVRASAEGGGTQPLGTTRVPT